MEVEVGDRLARVGARIGDQAIARLGDAFALGDPAYGRQEFTEERGVVRSEVVHALDVLDRHHQDMHRRGRVQVPERVGRIRSFDLGRRDRAPDDLAENAVAQIPAACRPRPDRRSTKSSGVSRWL